MTHDKDRGSLTLTRCEGEALWVGDVRIVISEIRSHRVRVVVQAPKEVVIEREEVRAARLESEERAREQGICTQPRRTRSQVLKERENAVGGGCCERFADNQACTCLEDAIDDGRSK